jgi:hypothetical protein
MYPTYSRAGKRSPGISPGCAAEYHPETVSTGDPRRKSNWVSSMEHTLRNFLQSD